MLDYQWVQQHCRNTVDQLPESFVKIASKLPNSDYGWIAKTDRGDVKFFPLLSEKLAESAVEAILDFPEEVQEEASTALLSAADELLSDQAKETLRALVEGGDTSEGALQGPADIQGPVTSGLTPALTDSDDILSEVELGSVLEDGKVAHIRLNNMTDVKHFAEFLEKNSHMLPSVDKRKGAMAIRKSFEKVGYDFEDPATFTKLSGFIRKYASLEADTEGLAYVLEDRLKALEYKESEKGEEAVKKGKEAYTLLCTGDIPVEELASSIEKLDEAFGLSPKVDVYETAFLPVGVRESTFTKLFDGTDEMSKRYTAAGVTVKGRDIADLKYRKVFKMVPVLGEDVVKALKASPLETFKSLDSVQQAIVIQWAWRFANETSPSAGRT